MGFFMFCMKYTFTSKKVVVIEIHEWKLKTILDINTTFKGNWDKIFAHFGSKIAKKALFIPVSSLPTQFSLKEKFVISIKHGKSLFFTETNCLQQMKETWGLKVLL